MKVTKHYLYYTYHNMLSRCNNKNRWNYKYYGGKGIKVCDRWLEKDKGFLNFISDMGDRPDKYQLDRIDVYQGYTPSNCRWVNKYVQMGNTTTNSRYVGVGWHKQRGKYRARIKVKGRDISLGLYNNLEDAIKARELAYNKLCI